MAKKKHITKFSSSKHKLLNLLFLQSFQHMMAQFTLVVVASLLSYCSAENVYCVTPTATSCSSCPHNNHCATLSEYAQDVEQYFTSNTTMVFLPGDHFLDRNVTVANVSSLTMHRESSSGNRATVVCSGSFHLIFINMVDLKIDSLAFTSFTSCGLRLYSLQYTELVNCSFHDNDGTALVVESANITLAGNSEFKHNHGLCGDSLQGGAIYAVGSNLTFTGNATFVDNSAGIVGGFLCNDRGGAIYTQNTVISFSGTTNFINNLAVGDGGGAIYTLDNTVLNFSGTSNFINNSVLTGYSLGGAIYTSGVLSFSGTTNFINNSAGDGGAVYTFGSNVLSFNGTTNFINNLAVGDSFGGGAIYILDNTLNFSGTTNFINNSGGEDGGAVYTSGVLNFSGTSNFINNSVLTDALGGAIYTSSVLSFSGTTNFINNSAGDGGAVYAFGSNVLSFNETTNFINNLAHSGGGAVYLENYSNLSFNGTVNFTNNICSVDVNGDTVGGGVYMGLQCTFSILPNTTVYWENNHASLGGAIYVEDASPTSYCTLGSSVPKEECFFQLPGQNLSNGIVDVQLVFKNNYADGAGSVLYGGAVDNCKLTHGLDSCSSGEVFEKIVQIEDDTKSNKTSDISSNPFQICPCENNIPHCRESPPHFPRTVYLGETFQVYVVAAGQMDGTVPSNVISTIGNIRYQGANLQGSQKLQQANKTCTKLNYTVLSSSQIQQVYIILYPAESPCSTRFDSIAISVSLYQTCPPGLSFSELERSCACEPRLAQYTNQCTITNGVGQITREAGQQFWVGYDKLSQSDELILHELCPFNYCVSHTVTFPLNQSDMQCAYIRSGLLCGACKEGYSLVLGTSHCKQCSNTHLALLIPFAVMGVALVFFLLVCKLTVATGTLSGLVFYANIVGPNRTIFLPVESTDAFSVFIAWLNLDLGIETCFYNGLDAYSKTWLQFVFPVYIWLLVGLIILVSHFSQRFANMLGNNPVSALATLILLSYAKILRTLIAVFYITYLKYPTYNRSVWLYDANIDYLSGKHIPLFLVSVLIFLFLFLPYTLLLLFGQWLQAISHLRLFSWVNSARLKPFVDAYHAPYKAKHRYWPGLLLVLRFVLLLVFALNPQQHSRVNLLVILVGAGIIQLWAWVSGGVYRNWCLDALEGSFALNLIILVGATFYVNRSRDQLLVGYTSISIAFVTFIGILVFQLSNVTGIAQYLKRKCTLVPIRNQAEAAEAEPLDIDSLPDRLINPEEYELPFHTSQGHTTTEPTEAQRRLIPAYTYGSID